MPEIRKLAAILAADVVGYSRLANADEDRTLARLRALRGDLIDPITAKHNGRVFKRTGDGILVEFRSAADAVSCGIEIQADLSARNDGLVPDQRLDLRIGIHIGDVVEESDGDLMGEGVNIAARLEGIAKPGSVYLSEDAYRQVRTRLDLAATELGEQKLKNIAQTFRVYAIDPAASSDKKSDSRGAPSSSSPRLSVVVLPFADLGGEPGNEYFADGITENLTTDLSQIAGSFVIARNTAFTYKGKAVDIKQLGATLGIRYAVEGSVQRGRNRLRVNVQLIDAETGNHLWAERFDKAQADLFDMQDEIVARLAAALNTQLIAAEARRAERTPTPDSMDFYFRGLACLHKGLAPADINDARAHFERAMELDARNLDALIGIAQVDLLASSNLMLEARDATLARVEVTLNKALSAAGNHALAHCLMGVVKMYTNRAVQGIAECQLSLSLDRNLAAAHGYIGLAKHFLGKGEETESHVNEALRLSPRDTNAYHWMVSVGVAKQALGADGEAVLWLRRAIESNRNFALAHFFLAGALAKLGQLEEAKISAAEGLRLAPDFTISKISKNRVSDNPVYLAQREPLIAGMRKAGVPEGE